MGFTPEELSRMASEEFAAYYRRRFYEPAPLDPEMAAHEKERAEVEDTFNWLTGRTNRYWSRERVGWREVEQYQTEIDYLFEKEANRLKNLPRLQAQATRRAKLHDALKHDFAAYGGRNIWIWHQHKEGRTLQSIADQIGLTKTRVNDIFKNVDRYKQWRAHIQPFDRPEINKGRPIDMGGPRDIWLTYFPSPDPRFDNMEATADGHHAERFRARSTQ
jgi:hypothetical protein